MAGGGVTLQLLATQRCGEAGSVATCGAVATMADNVAAAMAGSAL